MLNLGLMTRHMCGDLLPRAWHVWGSGADLVNLSSPVFHEASAPGVPPRKVSARTMRDLSCKFNLSVLFFRIILFFLLNYFLMCYNIFYSISFLLDDDCKSQLTELRARPGKLCSHYSGPSTAAFVSVYIISLR